MLRPRRPNISEVKQEERTPITYKRMVDYVRLLRYVWLYRGRMILDVVSLVTGTLLGLSMPLAVQNVVVWCL